ncbi:class I SAM-dependent methyltransferase [Paludibaculum fermentans]|uniref:Class I SAM-dependent methyltransferase n=1 Tax=Paludibaculum fermentans TaxID=1473598 RepID=A0A7S7SLI8_PALFE|nr:class I SAM-dependent methyltransferase [Paludibaculum fermentans]QOY88491.1 class I SAM-dependent methyltransferase [Paludibaculum fermentans]
MAIALMLFALLSGDTAWRQFSDWFSKEGTPGAPADVLQAYSKQLESQGVAADDVRARVKDVQDYLVAHPREGLTLHFNRIFTWKAAPFTREPSAFLRRISATRKPGRALDIAMGQGRNSIWLAKAGWTVSGYDISDEALRQANALASEVGVKLDTKLASHDEYELGVAQWDLIVMSYAFTNLHDAAYMKRVQDSLKPGGMLLIEGFGGGPPREPNQVLNAFLTYRVLYFEELPDIADWGQMKAPLMRMALEKP